MVRPAVQPVPADQQALSVLYIQYDPLNGFLAIALIVVLFVGTEFNAVTDCLNGGLEIRFFFSEDAIILEALEAESPNDSARAPDESSPFSRNVHNSIASLILTLNWRENWRSSSAMA